MLAAKRRPRFHGQEALISHRTYRMAGEQKHLHRYPIPKTMHRLERWTGMDCAKFETRSWHRRCARETSVLTSYNFTARMAISCINSSRRYRTSAMMNMADLWKTECAIRWKCSRRCGKHSPI